MTRARNRITGDDCRLTGETDSFGLIGVKYDDDPRTFFISPERLEIIERADLEPKELPNGRWSVA